MFDVIHQVATSRPAAQDRIPKNYQDLWKDPLDIGMNSEYREIDTILKNMDQMAENSPYNVRIMDLKEGIIDTIAAATQTTPSVPNDSDTATKEATSSPTECSKAVSSTHQTTKELATDAVTTASKKKGANSSSSKSTAEAATSQRVEACTNNPKVQA